MPSAKEKKMQFATPKGTELPMLDFRGKPYLQVAHRLVWFREEHPFWTIQTEEAFADESRAKYRASIRDDAGRLIATATKVETKEGFPDFVEKAETGAVGRALAMCGYGTQFAPELDEQERLADAPTTPAKRRAAQGGSEPVISEQQLEMIDRLIREIRPDQQAFSEWVEREWGYGLGFFTQDDADRLIQLLQKRREKEGDDARPRRAAREPRERAGGGAG